MRNIFKLLLAVLLLMVGLFGCNSGIGADDKAMSQRELWDYLGEHQRYLSEWGAQDCALVFKNGDDLIFDYSIYMGDEYNYYFTELINFSYEGDNLYKLEYENPYPDSFENAIFYIDSNSEIKNGFRFGNYYDDEINYVNVYADIGLTVKELYEALAKYNSWMEANTDIYGGYFVKAHDNDKFDFGLMNSGFWHQGTILKLEYHGYMHYTMTVDYPGYEGDEMTDPYDPYTADIYMYFNPYFESLIIELYNEPVEFTPERELTTAEFFTALAQYNTWIEVDTDVYGGFFIKAHDNNILDLGLMNSGFWIQGTVSDVVYHGNMYYTMTVDYPGYEGDEMTDPYDPYAAEYHLYYYPDNEVLLVKLYENWVEFTPERELTADEFFAELAKYNVWYEVDSKEYRGYFIKAYDNDKFDLGLLQTEFWLQGTITDVKYYGSMNYIVTVYYEGFEGNELFDPYDPYSLDYQVYYYPNNKRLFIVLYDDVVEFSPEG